MIDSTVNVRGSASASTARPQAQEIERGLKDGQDPLDFIRQNLRSNQGEAGASVNQGGSNGAGETSRSENTNFSGQGERETDYREDNNGWHPAKKASFVDNDIGLELPHETDPAEESGESFDAETDNADEYTDEQDEEATNKQQSGPQESIKNLRRKTGELSRTLEEKATEADRLKQELDKYKAGEATPEIVETLKHRVTELEHYEQLHNLRMSPDYTAKYLEPIEELKQKAIETAEAYGVDPNVLDDAFKLENRKELNKFLMRHFDDVGALEVRDILANIKKVASDAQKAEEAPAQALEQLREEQRAYSVTQDRQRIAKISATAKTGWMEALTELRSQGSYPELTLTGDAEHDKYVRPILNEAAAEYGKIVKEMGLSGTKELRVEAAKILAKRYLLSQAAAIAMESRSQHHQRAEEAISSAHREAAFIRPQVGGGVANTTRSSARQPSSPMEAADELLRRVGLK